MARMSGSFKTIPQGLKPGQFRWVNGRAKARPLQKKHWEVASSHPCATAAQGWGTQISLLTQAVIPRLCETWGTQIFDLFVSPTQAKTGLEWATRCVGAHGNLESSA